MSVPEIIEAAAAHYGLPVEALHGTCRSTVRRRGRDLAFRLLRAVADLDAPSIALLMGCHRQCVSTALRKKITENQERFESPVWKSILKQVTK